MGSVNTAKVIPDLIQDSAWEITALSCRMTRTFHGTFPTRTKYDDALLWYPELCGAGYPVIGQAHPSRKDTWVRALSARGLSNNDFEMQAHYEGIGKPGFTTARDSLQQQVIKNFDIYGNVTKIPFSPKLLAALSSLGQIIKINHVANIPKIIDLPCVRFTVMCDFATMQLYRRSENLVNAEDFNGDPPRTWLVLSIKADTENNKLFRVSGVLCYRQETWDGFGIYLDAAGNRLDMDPLPAPDKIAKDPTGLVGSGGVQPGSPNGWRRFIMYSPAPKFSELFLKFVTAQP